LFIKLKALFCEMEEPLKEPNIIEISSKKLVGARIINSLAEDKTGILWQRFMPKRKMIKNRVNSDYWSVQNYENFDPSSFTEDTKFEKWAAVEVSECADLPDELETFDLPAGKYAVFIHHGLASEFHKALRYIFETWLPASGFQLDERPHFEIMGSKYYGPTDANSEEETWIPIK
jgi:AraC family transcriptional regulator